MILVVSKTQDICLYNAPLKQMKRGLFLPLWGSKNGKTRIFCDFFSWLLKPQKTRATMANNFQVTYFILPIECLLMPEMQEPRFSSWIWGLEEKHRALKLDSVFSSKPTESEVQIFTTGVSPLPFSQIHPNILTKGDDMTFVSVTSPAHQYRTQSLLSIFAILHYLEHHWQMCISFH